MSLTSCGFGDSILDVGATDSPPMRADAFGLASGTGRLFPSIESLLVIAVVPYLRYLVSFDFLVPDVHSAFEYKFHIPKDTSLEFQKDSNVLY
jgi:hypothetical protein